MQTETASVNVVHFDLSPEGELCDGCLTFADGILTAVIGGRTVFSRDMAGAAELRQRIDVGCGSLELAMKSDTDGGEPDDSASLRVCRFTMTAVNDMAEMCKVVNYYLETGHEGQFVPVTEVRGIGHGLGRGPAVVIVEILIQE